VSETVLLQLFADNYHQSTKLENKQFPKAEHSDEFPPPAAINCPVNV
jgi:hypothetical protein